MKKLILTADDAGTSAAINRGIRRCLEAGVISAVSVTGNSNRLSGTADLCGTYEADTGLHINLTEGVPVSEEQSVQSLLTEEGQFLGRYRFFYRLLRGRIDRQELEHEIRGQLNQFQEAFGPPTHLNGHEHVHMLPQLYPVFADLAEEHDIPWLRWSAERVPLNRKSLVTGYAPKTLWRGMMRKLFIEGCSHMLQLRSAPHPAVRPFFGLLNAADMDANTLRRTLQSITSDTAEIALHPGLADAGGMPRQATLAALEDTEIQRYIQEEYDLIGFSDLPAPSHTP